MAGIKTLTAQLWREQQLQFSTSANVTQTVSKDSTATTTTVYTPNPSVPGQPVSVSFAVFLFVFHGSQSRIVDARFIFLHQYRAPAYLISCGNSLAYNSVCMP
jgi:hypothetical protein